jgi:apolipoprotein N-acyltransferase
MFASRGSVTQPRDRFSWGWLAVGALLLPFTAFQTVLPIAAWLAPVFLLRFTRTQHPLIALPVIALVHVVGVLIGLRNMLPPPVSYFAGAIGLAALIPYGADRLMALCAGFAIGSRLSGVARTLIFPLTITLMDWLGSSGPLGSGGTAAYSQYGNLALMQIVSITGVWGLTFLITWLGPVANDLWERAGDWPALVRRPPLSLALFAAVLLAVVLFGSARLAFATTTTPTVRVAGLTHDKKLWDALPHGSMEVARGSEALRAGMRPYYVRMLDELFTRTQMAARSGARIVVWSEVAAHILKEDEMATLEHARALARAEKIYLQVALNVILQAQQRPFAENRVILIDPAGAIIWDYFKTVHPFGDNAVFIPGPGVLPYADTPYGRLAAAICFDADFPGLMRQVGQASAGLLLLPSHDWAQAKITHMQINAFRAIENGVAMVRPTGDGVSLATDHLGRVLATADDFATVKPSLVVDMPVQGAPTVYARTGDLFVYLCIAAWVMLAGAAFWPRRGVDTAIVGEPVQA